MMHGQTGGPGFEGVQLFITLLLWQSTETDICVLEMVSERNEGEKLRNAHQTMY